MARNLNDFSGGRDYGTPTGDRTPAGNDHAQAVQLGTPAQYTPPPPPPPAASDYRNRQLQYLQELQLAAQGDSNSRAQQYLRSAYAQANNQVLSNTSRLRNVSRGVQLGQVQDQQAATNQTYNLDSRSLMAQERSAASQALLNELNYMGNQDINEAQASQEFAQRMQGYQDEMNTFYDQARLRNALRERERRIGLTRISEGMDLDTQAHYAQYGVAGAQAAATGLEALSNMKSSSTAQADEGRQIDSGSQNNNGAY